MARGAEACAAMVARADSSGWLKKQFKTDRDMRISHEAIYRSLFVQTRGVLKKELTAQLRFYKAADASRQRRQGQEWTGAHTRYGLYP